MKIFQLRSFFHKRAIPKKMLLLITLLIGLFNINAQDEDGIKLLIEPGLLLKSNSDNVGLILNAEPRLNISKNMIIGMRFGLALNSQKFENIDNSQFYIDDDSDNAVISFVPTFDYYLNEDNYRPYIGLGLGYYLLSDVDVFQFSTPDAIVINIKNQIGILLRGGFESGSLRLGLEYNYIPKADIVLSNNQTIGSINSKYFGLSIGFTIGNRKS